ncbi:MAG: hypothetical protein QOE90_1518 [Thermoplasmata archaeon]|jgi:hypothetical protein|nr:hypothetical protein [Thermoplasmata archaeon]
MTQARLSRSPQAPTNEEYEKRLAQMRDATFTLHLFCNLRGKRAYPVLDKAATRDRLRADPRVERVNPGCPGPEAYRRRSPHANLGLVPDAPLLIAPEGAVSA